MRGLFTLCCRTLAGLFHSIANCFTLLRWLWRHRQAAGFYSKPAKPQSAITNHRFQPKPEWVRQEVIRLSAHMNVGCRSIAHQFNRLHESKQHMTVSKSFVYDVMKQHRYEIQVLRQALKHRKPRPLPRNLIWQMDLTAVGTKDHQQHTVLGVIDSGTRLNLCLDVIVNKASTTLLRCLCDVIDSYGKPRIIRTDNEAVMTSRLFRFGLWLMHIKHQHTEVACPWMNSKIERLFGTLKAALKTYRPKSGSLGDDLNTFRLWYNHIRPHQHLDGRTPAEAWLREPTTQYNTAHEFVAWERAPGSIWHPHEPMSFLQTR